MSLSSDFLEDTPLLSPKASVEAEVPGAPVETARNLLWTKWLN
jgi:hypothetical protein